jgi:hypothetical protein
MPLELEFTWGPIRIEDRLHVVNDYLSFGGRLTADRIDDATILVFVSPAPLLRRGGHSQPWDTAAEGLGAFFARLRVPIAADAEVESAVSAAGPLARYAAFVADTLGRSRRSPQVRGADPRQWILLHAEERRLRRDHPRAWLAGLDLLEVAGLAQAIGPADPRGRDVRHVAGGRAGRRMTVGGAA